jgi:hypothetical protein
MTLGEFRQLINNIPDEVNIILREVGGEYDGDEVVLGVGEITLERAALHKVVESTEMWVLVINV